MVTNIREERRKPLLSLDTAAPEPKLIEIDDQNYEIRAVESYSTRERKRMQTLLVAIVEYEASEEENITVDDENYYEQALRQVTYLAMPDLPDAVHQKLQYSHYGAIAAQVLTLFRERSGARGENVVPEPSEQEIKPTRLRKLREILNSPTRSHTSLDSMEEDDPANG